MTRRLSPNLQMPPTTSLCQLLLLLSSCSRCTCWDSLRIDIADEKRNHLPFLCTPPLARRTSSRTRSSTFRGMLCGAVRLNTPAYAFEFPSKDWRPFHDAWYPQVVDVFWTRRYLAQQSCWHERSRWGTRWWTAKSAKSASNGRSRRYVRNGRLGHGGHGRFLVAYGVQSK